MIAVARRKLRVTKRTRSRRQPRLTIPPYQARKPHRSKPELTWAGNPPRRPNVQAASVGGDRPHLRALELEELCPLGPKRRRVHHPARIRVQEGLCIRHSTAPPGECEHGAALGEGTVTSSPGQQIVQRQPRIMVSCDALPQIDDGHGTHQVHRCYLIDCRCPSAKCAGASTCVPRCSSNDQAFTKKPSRAHSNRTDHPHRMRPSVVRVVAHAGNPMVSSSRVPVLMLSFRGRAGSAGIGDCGFRCGGMGERDRLRARKDVQRVLPRSGRVFVVACGELPICA